MRAVKLINALDGSTFESKVKETLYSIIKKTESNHIVKLDIYVNSSDKEQFLEEESCIRESIKEIFKSKIPAFSIIFQDLNNNTDFTIQYQFYSKNIDVRYKKILKHPYVVAENMDCIEVFSGAISFKEDSLLFSTQRCFDFAEQILMAEDMNFGHIYKQWNYIPDITGLSFYDQSKRGNLNIFNEVKGFFYEESLFVNGKPLISNINNYNDILTIDFNAIIKKEKNESVVVMEDIIIKEKKSLEVKYIFNGKNEFWFSSKHDLDKPSLDIEQQTIQSLKNIFLLKKNPIADLKNIEESFGFVTVYVKQEEESDIVKKLINGLIPDIDVLLLETDFIEGNSFVNIQGLISC